MNAPLSPFVARNSAFVTLNHTTEGARGSVVSTRYDTNGKNDFPKGRISAHPDYYFFERGSSRMAKSRLQMLMDNIHHAPYGSFIGAIHVPKTLATGLSVRSPDGEVETEHDHPHVLISWTINPDTQMPDAVPNDLRWATLNKWLFSLQSPFMYMPNIGNQYYHRGWVRATAAGEGQMEMHECAMQRKYSDVLAGYSVQLAAKSAADVRHSVQYDKANQAARPAEQS